MIKINIKPCSVNNAWQGRRFKTLEYKQYEKNLLLILPQKKIPQGKLKIKFEIGFSNKNSDIDNPIKLIIDIMQKKWGFNDRQIYELIIKKVIVKRGNEFIKFKIQKL